MDKKVLALWLLLGLVVVAEASPAKLDDLEGQYQSRSGLDDDDDDDDEKRPYSFAWEASRHYHGAPDREHREERGPDGVTRGVFRYVDPSLRVQEVIYTADDNGFHVENTNEPEYTPAQIAEREKHAQLFQKIAEEHSKIGSEHALRAAELGYEPQTYDAPIQVEYPDGNVDPASLPQFTPVLEKARNLHQDLFERIRAQHARIAAERKTDPADEETGEPYEYQYDTPLKTVEVVSGSVGPSLLARAASVVAPGEDHPDFQGYGVPLGTFRDDITEEEALMLLMQADAAHIERFQSEADLHEALVLQGPEAVAALRSRLNQQGLHGSSDSLGGFRQGVSGSTKSLSSPGSDNRHQGNTNPRADKRKANALQSRAGNSSPARNQVSQAHSQGSRSAYAAHQQGNRAGGQIPRVAQDTEADVQNQATATGQYSAGSQGSQGSAIPGHFNAANQGTGHQYNVGSQGGQHNNQPAASVRQSAAGHQGSPKYSSGNQVRVHSSGAQVHSSPHQHAAPSSTGTTKFSAGSNAGGNTGGANFNQGTAKVSKDQAKFSSLGGANKQSTVRQHQSALAGQSQSTAHSGQSQYAANSGQPQYAANSGQSQASNAAQSNHGANSGQSQYAAHAGPRQVRPNNRQSAVGGQQQNFQHQLKVPASQSQASHSGHNQYSNAGRAQANIGQGSGFADNRQTGAGAQYNNADQEEALAIIAEQRDNHLRQFRKIAKAHEEIGDEHHQLTLAALQKQRMKLQAW